MTDEIIKTDERHIEVEGQIVVCLVRVVCDESEETLTRNQWSFDRGEAWHNSMAVAYEDAKGKGALMRVGSTDENADGFEAFLLGLVHELGALEDGECLKIVKSGGTVVVVKEQAVLSCRASAIKDVDLRMEAQDG